MTTLSVIPFVTYCSERFVKKSSLRGVFCFVFGVPLSRGIDCGGVSVCLPTSACFLPKPGPKILEPFSDLWDVGYLSCPGRCVGRPPARACVRAPMVFLVFVCDV